MKHGKRLALLIPLLLVGVALAAAAQRGGERLVLRAELRDVIAVQEAYTERLMRNPFVVGTAVGVDDRNEGVVKVFVERRRGIQGVPGRLDSVPVQVEVTGPIFARKGPPGSGVDPTARFDRPVPIGVSTGHPDITAGTISCRVSGGGTTFALSNNHVYANENLASLGDAVIQPGTFDGGSSPDDDIGTLFDFEPIVFSTSADNVIDAAIAESSTSLVGTSTPSDGYGTPKSATIAAAVNMDVQKYGRTTGQTDGRVDSINATVNVGYDSGTARFIGQIVIRPGNFSAGGDSGSCIVVDGGADDRRPVGLLFAGSNSVTIANPIDEVLSAFGVSIDGE